MKSASDPRHLKRIKAVKSLFSWSFNEKTPKNELAKNIIENRERIDQLIKKSAPEWPINQINRIDLAILRLATFELKMEIKEPAKVIIDEAIEIAKSFGSEKSSAFINGALGALMKQEKND
jgi:N utilization substance protein B